MHACVRECEPLQLASPARVRLTARFSVVCAPHCVSACRVHICMPSCCVDGLGTVIPRVRGGRQGAGELEANPPDDVLRMQREARRHLQQSQSSVAAVSEALNAVQGGARAH